MARTAVFRKLVGQCMGAAPLVVGAGVTSGEVVRRMAEKGATAAIVIGREGRPCGIVTEQDIVRRLAFRAPPETPVGDVMTSPVMTIRTDDYLYHAIARMRRFGLRHMPVVDLAGVPVGMLNLDAALAVAADRLIHEIDILTQEETLDGLREVKAAEVELAENLLSDAVPVPEIQSVLTHINRDIHRRVLERGITAMEAAGKGPPPVPFAFLVMGSGGRGENFIYPDQDNAMILDDYPDEEHARIDAWFIDLAERVTRDLDAIGFPYCKGYAMVTNPVWRKTRSQWRAQIAGWCGRRNVVALRLFDIFFDFRPICGALDLAAELRSYVTELMKVNRGFLRDLQYDDDEYGVGLGWFGRFITEKENRAHRGELNLKTTGTMPLVQATRLMALREGIGETSTLERLAALHARNLIDDDTLDYLNGAFEHITLLLLRQQLADFKAGREVTSYVPPDRLSERERDLLVEYFQAIRRFRSWVRSELTGDLF